MNFRGSFFADRVEPLPIVGAGALPANMDDALHEEPPPNVLSLPIDVLAIVLSSLANVCCSAIAQFGTTCHISLAIVKDSRFIALCAHKMNVPPPMDGSHALETLAMHQAVLENIGTLPWLLFKPGGAELKPGEVNLS